jgi:hypothetical protein
MRDTRCWALFPDGTRCPLASLHGGYFCGEHRLGCQPDPALIFRAPVAEMPNDLVQYLRAAAPEVAFPEPAPPVPAAPSATPAPAPAPSPSQSGTASPLPVPDASSQTLSPDPAPEDLLPSLSVSPHKQHPHCLHDPGSVQAPAPGHAALPPEAPAQDRDSEAGASDMYWLMGLLKQAMLGVMEGDSQSLQKANAVARLANFYLKASGAAELKRANTLLRKQLSERERRFASAETPGRDEETGSARSSSKISLRAEPAGRPENSRLGAEKGHTGAAGEKTAGRGPGRPGDPTVQIPAGRKKPGSHSASSSRPTARSGRRP